MDEMRSFFILVSFLWFRTCALMILRFGDQQVFLHGSSAGLVGNDHGVFAGLQVIFTGILFLHFYFILIFFARIVQRFFVRCSVGLIDRKVIGIIIQAFLHFYR